MAKRKRTYNLRKIKATWPYSVQEVSACLGVHKGAVLRWLNEGLHADRSRRPYLIRGDELIRFLSARRQKRRRKCRLTQFYCFRCRDAREAYERAVDIICVSPNRLHVKGICGICNTPVSKVQSIKNLEKIQAAFQVMQLVGLHLIECATPSVNSDLEAHK